jgi:hypothetical protein
LLGLGFVFASNDDISLPDYEINILSPIRGTYQNNHLFYFPEAYERLENIVKTYPTELIHLTSQGAKYLAP